MFGQQLLASGGTRRFSSRALHDPLRRLQENGTDSNSHVGHDVAADLTFDVVRLLQKILFLHLRNDHDIFCSKIGIEYAQSNGATVVDRRMAADNLFDVLRIDVLATDDEQIFLAAHNIEFAIEAEAKVARIIPAVANRFLSEIGTVVVSLEQ